MYDCFVLQVNDQIDKRKGYEGIITIKNSKSIVITDKKGKTIC